MRKQTVIVYALVASAAVFVGCSGGGQQSSVPATTAGGPNVPAAPQGMSKATFTLTIPGGSSASAANRKPAYISSATQSMSIVVQNGTASPAAPVIANLTPGSPGCTAGATGTTCAVTVAAPVGNDTFVVTLYLGQNGGGSVLSSATISGTVVAATANSFPVTLGGTATSVQVSVTNGNNLIPGGFATSLPVVVTARDASGAIIIGPGDYSNPITLTNADTSGITSLSTTNVTSPSTPVTLTYAPTDANGGVLAINGLPVGATTIGASAQGVQTSAITPGTFQYIADRFFGFGHTRTLSGTSTVTITTYNGTGTPSPSPSTFSYTITDAVTVHAAAVPSGAPAGTPPLLDSHHLWTYTQVSPTTTTAPETQTIDEYRGDTLNASGAIVYQYAKVSSGTNSGTATSPITGDLAGTSQNTTNWQSPLLQFDVLPHAATTWSNSTVPFTQTWTGAMVANQTNNADGSWNFSETVPNTITQSQDASGNAVNAQGTGPGINANNINVTTTISVPIPKPSGTGFVIPVARQTTAPTPGPTANLQAADWYPGGGAPTPPLFTYNWSEALVAIPGGCNVPGTIATQAYAVTQVQNWLRTAIFQYRQRTQVDYYAPGGVGFVCETFTETTENHNFGSGIISSLTTISYTVGVTSANSLSVGRRR